MKRTKGSGTSRGARLLAGSVLYQVVWFCAVLSAGQAGRWWWGPASALLFLAIAGGLWPLLWTRVWKMAVVALACGVVVDTLMIVLGAWSSPRMLLPAPLPPLWLLVLWFAFGVYIALSLDILYGRYAVSALVGALGGTLAYRGGMLLGAIEWGQPAWLATLWVMLAWALVFPCLTGLAGKWSGRHVPGRSLDAKPKVRVALM